MNEPDSNDIALFGLDAEDERWMDFAREAELPIGLGAIGPFTLLREIGRGGQGIVYAARQEELSREVAVKRPLHGACSDDRARRRFEREVELAASLSHPNIVSVHAAQVQDGQLLLAMELVDGVPITTWSKGRALAQVFGAFYQLCQAIGYAHQRGVIHRDLKPSNILVDSDGRVRVLDFGLSAVLVDGATRSEPMLGTPAYLSPEQATGHANGADVRSDVYTLGLVLHECLTGSQVHHQQPGEGILTTLRRIAEEEPRLSSREGRPLPKELRLLLTKALAREPALRYQSCEELERDLRAFEDGRPMRAHPPSVLYSVRKSVSRHRWPWALAAGVAIGVAIVSVQQVAARQLRRESKIAQDKAAEAQSTAEAVSRFLEHTFMMGDPRLAGDAPMTLAEAIDAGAASADKDLGDSPLIAAGVHRALADAYYARGYSSAAVLHARRAVELSQSALPADDVRLLDLRRSFGAALIEDGKYSQAAEELSIVVKQCETLGSALDRLRAMALADLATALSLSGDFKGADVLWGECQTLTSTAWGARSGQVATTQMLFAEHLYRTHETERARSLLRDGLQLCRELGDTGHAGATLITLSLVEPDLDEAQKLADQGIAIFEELYPQGHPNIGMAHARMGERLRYAGRFREAELRLRRAVDPALHTTAPDLELAWLALGETLVNRGEVQPGLDFMSKALDSRRSRLGQGAVPTLSASLRFAEQCLAAHLPARALALAADVLAQDPANAAALRIEGLAFMAEGNLDASRERLERVLAACTALPESRAWEAGLAECDLADLMILCGQADRARQYLESAMARDDRPSKVHAIGVRSRLALASLSQTPTERVRMLREACRAAAASATARLPDLSECRVRLAAQLIETESGVEAKELLEQARSDIEDRLGTSHPRYQHVLELLNLAR